MIPIARGLRRSALALALAVAALASGAAAQQQPDKPLRPSPIPERPEQLTFAPLRFEVPDVEEVRHRLSNGTPVFIAEDHSLPLVEVSLTFRGGSYLESADETGLASLTGTLLRDGGTARTPPAEFDEQVEFLAARFSAFGGDVSSGAAMSCISQVFEECFDLFFEMVRTPGFDAQRLDIEKGKALEAMKQRNDDAEDILRREWSWLLFGEKYFAARSSTASELAAISREDLAEFHRRVWRPDQMIVSVSGDVDTQAILKRLEGQLAGWEAGSAAPAWPPPRPGHQPRPGLYFVDKAIPQGKVTLGQLQPQVVNWSQPDLPALRVMNQILGGGGFSSRLVQRIRSDEGLAYHASSRLDLEPFWPSQLSISYQSKSSTVALAGKIALEQVQRLQDEEVPADELSLAKSSLVDSFPRRFESARQVVGTYAFDELIGRDPDYWQTWREGIEAVGAADVQRVARDYLDPARMVVLVVGEWRDIAADDPARRAEIGDLAAGEPTRLPLRDPLTLQPIE